MVTKYLLTLEVVALVCLGDDFEHLQIFFDDTKKKLSPIQNRVFNQNVLSEEINKRLKIVKLIKDRNTKRNNFILYADNKIFKQDVMEKKSFKLFFDTKEFYGKISDVFEVPNFVSSKNLVILATQENYLVEIDIDKVDQHSDNTIISFLTKLKQEGKTKITKYEINYNYSSRKPSHTYYSFVSLEDNKNPRNIIKFDENIVTLKFRPKNPILKQNNNQFYIKNQKAKQFINNNHVAISFGNNTLNIFHYESKCQVYEFVSYYGNFICLEYTPDGRLLGAGTESDQLYILDAELNTLIYTLEGHKNYITNIIFFENIADNDEITSSASTKVSDNNNSSKPTEVNLEQTRKRRSSSIRIKIQEVSLGEMRSHILKENYSNADTLQIENIRLSRTGKSEIFDNNDENKIILTYDILTTGMDGCVAVWRIEHSYDEFMFNEKNYPDISTYSQSFNLCKTDNVLPLNLFPHDRTKISYSSFLKISNNPIIKMIYNENFFVFITKKISTGGIIHLKIYNGVTKVEEEIIETNFLTQGNSNEDTDAMITERHRSYSHVNNNSSTKVDHLNKTDKIQRFQSSETKKHLNTTSSEKSESSKSPIPSYSDNKRIYDKDTKRNKNPMKDNNVKK